MHGILSLGPGSVSEIVAGSGSINVSNEMEPDPIKQHKIRTNVFHVQITIF